MALHAILIVCWQCYTYLLKRKYLNRLSFELFDLVVHDTKWEITEDKYKIVKQLLFVNRKNCNGLYYSFIVIFGLKVHDTKWETTEENDENHVVTNEVQIERVWCAYAYFECVYYLGTINNP